MLWHCLKWIFFKNDLICTEYFCALKYCIVIFDYSVIAIVSIYITYCTFHSQNMGWNDYGWNDNNQTLSASGFTLITLCKFLLSLLLRDQQQVDPDKHKYNAVLNINNMFILVRTDLGTNYLMAKLDYSYWVSENQNLQHSKSLSFRTIFCCACLLSCFFFSFQQKLGHTFTNQRDTLNQLCLSVHHISN